MIQTMSRSTRTTSKELHYNKCMQDKIELVAHNEHILDDVDAVFENDNLSDSVKTKIVEMIETYIATSIETVVENPEWFTA